MASSHTISVLVDNEPGILARVVGLFTGRGYNIESLTVSETEHDKHVSRITIVTSGTPAIIDQIEAQLGRLVPVGDGDAVVARLAILRPDADRPALKLEPFAQPIRLGAGHLFGAVTAHRVGVGDPAATSVYLHVKARHIT